MEKYVEAGGLLRELLLWRHGRPPTRRITIRDPSRNWSVQPIIISFCNNSEVSYFFIYYSKIRHARFSVSEIAP
jgi:hypothetical protein